MKKELEKYYENLKIIESIKESLKISREAFEETLTNQLNDLKVAELDNIDLKEAITNKAIQEYTETGEKKLIGGLGIRITNKLNYNKVDAIDWALDNMKVAVYTELDKKQFENYAKCNELEFVKKIENIGVTFPKEFKGSELK